MVVWVFCSSFNIRSCFFLCLRPSIKNRIPAAIRMKLPTTAKAKDQPMSLCSQLGIQSRPSPLAPNIITAITPHTPAKVKLPPVVHRSSWNLSWWREQQVYKIVRKLPISNSVRHNVKKNCVATKKSGRSISCIM